MRSVKLKAVILISPKSKKCFFLSYCYTKNIEFIIKKEPIIIPLAYLIDPYHILGVNVFMKG